MDNAYGLDADYFIKLFARELNPDVVRNQTPDCLARVLARAAKTASSKVLAEPEFQFNYLRQVGQIKPGDEIRFTLSGITIDAIAVDVLSPGTEKEEIVYNRKRNHYFITTMAIAGTSSHGKVMVRIKPGYGPDPFSDSHLNIMRQSGLSIDGDNAYKRDLLDAVVGAMMLGRHNTTPPPAEHWAQRFWDIGREYAELPGAIVLPMPVMPEQPEDAIDDSWMDGYNAALRMREECQRAIDAAGLAAPVVNQQLTTATPSKTCTWKLDWETGAYKLGCCNQTWHFTDGTAEENGAIFCHHCAGEIVADEPVLRAYQVGDNDIVAAYDPAGARKVLCEFNGYPDDQYEDSEVELVSDKVLDNTEAFDIDEGKTITLEKTLRQELAELTEPAYLHGWE